MSSFLKKNSTLAKRIRNNLSNFWARLIKRTPKSNILSETINQQLVYTLAPSKIPNQRQLHYLQRFLNPRENLAIKICVLIVLANAIFLGWRFCKNHLELSPASGGDYSEGIVGYPQTINPLYATNRDVDSDLVYLIYSRLFAYDGVGQLKSDLVSSFTVSSDGKEYTLKLKDRIKWHDGETLNADDVLFTFALVQDPDYRSPLRLGFDGVILEKVDDLTIKFILPQAYSAFPSLLTFGIMPEHLWSNISPSAATVSELNLKPVGSGPFKFESLIKNKNGRIKEYHLERNNDYYNQPPYLKNLVLRFFPDVNELISAFNDGQADGLSYLPWESKKDLLAQNSLDFQELKLAQVNAVFFNPAQNKSLSDKRVRQALTMAIDCQALINKVFGPAASLANGPIPNFSPFYDQQLAVYNYNKETAEVLLKEALTVKIAGTRKTPARTETASLELTLTAVDTAENHSVADLIKTDWEKIGVKVNLNFVAPEEVNNSIIHNKDYQALLYGEVIGSDPDIYAFWHSSQTGDKGLNLANYNNSTVDKLLESARTALDNNDRLNQYKKIQEAITADVPAAFLYTPSYSYIQTKKIKGFAGQSVVEPADRFSSINDWYLKTKKKLVW